MNIFSRLFIRGLAASLALLLICTQSVFAYSAESNFWKERKLARLPMESLAPQMFSAIKEPQNLPLMHLTPKSPLLNSLSYAYGTVRRFSVPKNNAGQKTVIHIQDVHANLEAQANISKTVQKLIEDQRVDLIALEGASDQLVLEALHSYSDQNAVRVVADYLLSQNKISGAVHGALVSKKGLPQIIGIDDAEHYQANVDAYQKASLQSAAAKVKIEVVRKQLSNQKAETFGSALREFDGKIEAYRAGAIDFGVYVNLLAEKAGSESSETKKFLQARALESSLNFALVEKERSLLLNDLGRKLDQQELSSLASAGVAFRLGQINTGDFYSFLKSLSEKNHIKLSRYPTMETYFQYVSLCDQIEAERLFSEVKNLEEAAYAALSKTGAEKALIRDSKWLALTSKLVGFSLTKEEWAEYNQLAKIPNDPIGLTTFERFYSEAEIRDQKMAENILNAMKKSGLRNAVLVTGGFHSSGIDKELTQAGASVVTFVPNISKGEANSGADYLSAFSQEKTPLQKLFEGDKLFLASHPFPPFEQKVGAPAAVALAHEMGTLGDVPPFGDRQAFEAAGGDAHFDLVATDDGKGQGTAVISGRGGRLSMTMTLRGGKIEQIIVAAQRSWQNLSGIFGSLFSAHPTEWRRAGAAIATVLVAPLLMGASGNMSDGTFITIVASMVVVIFSFVFWDYLAALIKMIFGRSQPAAPEEPRTASPSSIDTLAEIAADKVFAVWRRSYDVPPPPDEAGISESLKDTGARAIPYFTEKIQSLLLSPQKNERQSVLLSAHGNTFRALSMHLFGFDADEVADFTFPLATVVRVRFSDAAGKVEAVQILESADQPSNDPKNVEALRSRLAGKGIAVEVVRVSADEAEARAQLDKGPSEFGELLMLRHGQTEASDTNPGGGFFAGWLDVKLTDEGRKQAAGAGRVLGVLRKITGLNIGVAFTSDLTRAHDTLMGALNAAALTDIPVIRSEQIKERHYGALAGRDRKTFRQDLVAAIKRLWEREKSFVTDDARTLAIRLSAEWKTLFGSPPSSGTAGVAGTAAKLLLLIVSSSFLIAAKEEGDGFPWIVPIVLGVALLVAVGIILFYRYVMPVFRKLGPVIEDVEREDPEEETEGVAPAVPSDTYLREGEEIRFIEGIKFISRRVDDPKANVLVGIPLDRRAVDLLRNRTDVSYDVLHPSVEQIEVSPKVRKPGVNKDQFYAIAQKERYTHLIPAIDIPINEDLFVLMPALKAITSKWVGYNNIDITAAGRRNIFVSNSASGSYSPLNNAMGELNIGLAGYLSLDLPHSVTVLNEETSDPRALVKLATGDNREAVVQLLWAALLQESLQIPRMGQLCKDGRFLGCGSGPEATVFHDQLGRDDKQNILPVIGLTGSPEYVLRLAEIAFAHEVGVVRYHASQRLSGTDEKRLNLTYVDSLEALTARPSNDQPLYIVRAPGSSLSFAGSPKGFHLIDVSRIVVNDNSVLDLSNSLWGKSIGIMGLGGRIGRNIAQRAISLGMQVVGTEKFPTPAALADLAEQQRVFNKAHGTQVPEPQFMSLEDIADMVDVITPLVDLYEGPGGTRGLISKEILARLKPGAIVLSTARGPVFDEEAMIELARKEAAKAKADPAYKPTKFGIDVLVKESDAPNNPLVTEDLPNVIVTGHTGSAVTDVRFGMERTAIVDNLFASIDGGSPQNLVPVIKPEETHARLIWDAGTEHVKPKPIIKTVIQYNRQQDILEINGRYYHLRGKKLYLVGLGKAADEMIAAFPPELIERIDLGQVNCLKKRQLANIYFEVGGHPKPDMGSFEGGQKILRLLKDAEQASVEDGQDYVVIAAITGGGSAIAAVPDGEILLGDLRATTKLLQDNNVDIGELNAVRGVLDQIKASRLRRAALHASDFITLTISDVPTMGDDISVIASGPTVASNASYSRAREILVEKGLWDRVPQAVRDHIDNNMARGDNADTDFLRPGSPVVLEDQYLMLAKNSHAVQAAADRARQLGYEPIILPDTTIRGDVSDVAEEIFQEIQRHLNDGKRIAIIGGGESTVEIPKEFNRGHGGRNTRLVLLLAEKLKAAGTKNALVLSGGTDGVDGNEADGKPSRFAGAVASAATILHAEAQGISAQDALIGFNSTGFFEEAGKKRGHKDVKEPFIGDIILTGNTGTNVADLFVGLIWPTAPAGTAPVSMARALPQAVRVVPLLLVALAAPVLMGAKGDGSGLGALVMFAISLWVTILLGVKLYRLLKGDGKTPSKPKAAAALNAPNPEKLASTVAAAVLAAERLRAGAQVSDSSTVIATLGQILEDMPLNREVGSIDGRFGLLMGEVRQVGVDQPAFASAFLNALNEKAPQGVSPSAQEFTRMIEQSAIHANNAENANAFMRTDDPRSSATILLVDQKTQLNWSKLIPNALSDTNQNHKVVLVAETKDIAEHLQGWAGSRSNISVVVGFEVFRKTSPGSVRQADLDSLEALLIGRFDRAYLDQLAVLQVVIPVGMSLSKPSVSDYSLWRKASFILINELLQATALSFESMDTMMDLVRLVSSQA